MNKGIYVHIPFCKSRCVYCGFYSTTHAELCHRYTKALLHEMELRSSVEASLSHYNTDTVYFGGGTPSVLDLSDMELIFHKISAVYPGNMREVTVEMNPDDVTPQYVSALKSFGVNRISMGVQSFDDNRLRFLRRRHSASQAIKAYNIIRQAGIGNISIDLMFGFPKENIGDWQNDIKTALSLDPNHISAYCLMYEEGTPLHKMLEAGKVKQIDEETYVAMYTELIDQLTSHGYEHYEISNFAKHGYRSIHNSSYWHDVPYLGFGASAHSYNGKRRLWNIDNLQEYIMSVEQGVLPAEYEDIDADTHYNDLVTTALRTCEGLDLSMLHNEYREYALKSASYSLSNNNIELCDNHLRLTRKGLFVIDLIMSDLIKV